MRYHYFRPTILADIYDQKIRLGRQIAEKSKITIITNPDLIDLSCVRSTTELFQESSIQKLQIINTGLQQHLEPPCTNLDFVLYVDPVIQFWNPDGILNSIGWAHELKCSKIYGTIKNSKNQIVCYGTFDTEYQGEKIEWGPGNIPMRIKEWSNHFVLETLLDGENFMNPSMMGLL